MLSLCDAVCLVDASDRRHSVSASLPSVPAAMARGVAQKQLRSAKSTGIITSFSTDNGKYYMRRVKQ